jgi:type II secretory pathway predicted ATPase ExeA
MYESFYKLRDEPFRLSPDPYYCFKHRSYVKAEGYLRYGVQRAEGIIIVTGMPGTGKSTLVSELLKDFTPSKVLIGTLCVTRLDTDNLFRAVAYAMNLTVEGMDRASVLRTLELYLSEQAQRGKRALLVVDEAQNLTHDGLEDLRLLTNLQMGNRPLLQIFLLGQDSLRDKVQDAALKQLLQRVIAACHLESLEVDETRDYVEQRLTLAGWQGDPELTDDAFILIHKYSCGIPRRINQLCSRLFLYGSVDQKHVLGGGDVQAVLEDFRQELLVPADEQSNLEEITRAYARGAYQPRVVTASSRPAGVPPEDRPRRTTTPPDRPSGSARVETRDFDTHPQERHEVPATDRADRPYDTGPRRLHTVSKGTATVNETLKALADDDDLPSIVSRFPRGAIAPQRKAADSTETAVSGAQEQPSLYADGSERRGRGLAVERKERFTQERYHSGPGRSWLTLLLAVALLLTSIYAANPLIRNQFGIDVVAMAQDKLSALIGITSPSRLTPATPTPKFDQRQQSTVNKTSPGRNRAEP